MANSIAEPPTTAIDSLRSPLERAATNAGYISDVAWHVSRDILLCAFVQREDNGTQRVTLDQVATVFGYEPERVEAVMRLIAATGENASFDEATRTLTISQMDGTA